MNVLDRANRPRKMLRIRTDRMWIVLPSASLLPLGVHLLDRRAVAEEGDRHLEALRRDVADGRLDVVRDPLDEVAAVLVPSTSTEHGNSVSCFTPLPDPEATNCSQGDSPSPAG